MYIIPPPKSYFYSYEKDSSQKLVATPKEPEPPTEPTAPTEPDYEKRGLQFMSIGFGGLALFYAGISQPHSSYEAMQTYIVAGSTIAATGLYGVIDTAIESVRSRSE